ncbi:MAG: zinc ABC transporter substrate-binding protein [Kiritimatiellia bacterium]|jgi:zinc transport system substrate-binding protein|nr:zinc ABC transporter substrate-binding protein [Kiritimatiellia bacterium]
MSRRPLFAYPARLFPVALPLLLLLSGGARGAERPLVLVSIPPQAWLVKRLAGERVAVESMLADAADPHLFEPDARQARRLAEAALVFTLGLPFERALLSRAARMPGGPAFRAMDAGIAKRGARHDHSEPGHVCSGADGDPHIWLSPGLMCVMASNTVAALAERFPPHRGAFGAALGRTVAEICAVDAEVRERLRPVAPRAFAVYHPSWGYFAEAYGLVPLVLEQEGKAPPARHLAELIVRARAAGVRTVFTEPQYDPRPARALAGQLGARAVLLNPLQEDWPALLRRAAAALAGEECGP